MKQRKTIVNPLKGTKKNLSLTEDEKVNKTI